jgi:hypothetical protein
MHVFQTHTMLVVEPTAHVDRGGVRPFGRADGLAFQILSLPDLAFLVHVERGEPEQPRADDGQANNVAVGPRDLRHELGKRQLTDVPVPIEREAGEDFMMAERQPGVVDAFGLDQTGPEVAKVVVVGRCDRQLQLIHFVLPHFRGKNCAIRSPNRCLHHSILKFKAGVEIILRCRQRDSIADLSGKHAAVARQI